MASVVVVLTTTLAFLNRVEIVVSSRLMRIASVSVVAEVRGTDGTKSLVTLVDSADTGSSVVLASAS